MKYRHWIDVNHKQAQQTKQTIPPDVAQKWYRESPEIDGLVDYAAQAKRTDGTPLIGREDGLSDEAYRARVVGEVKRRYLYSGYYDAAFSRKQPDIIREQIVNNAKLTHDTSKIMAALEGEEIRLQQKIHAQRGETYTPPAIYPKEYWTGWKTSPPDPTV